MDTGSSSEPSFYTLSSNQNDVDGFSSTNITSPSSTTHSRTHDTSGSTHHLSDLSKFVEALDQSAKRAFPNHIRSQPRYSSVEVLLLRWEQDDLNIAPELLDLQRAFDKYNFSIETWLIPTEQSHRRLMLKAGEFVDKYDNKDSLMIVYYGGHAFINEARQSTWCWQYASLDRSAVETLFESATSDVLLLLDCCAAAASSAPKGGNALTETIAACGWESIAAEPGRFSFTSALIEVLDEWITRTFSVAMLHSKVLSVLKHERPELLGGTQRVECRRTPVYIVTTENPQVSSITLSRIKTHKSTNDPTLPSKSGNQGFYKRGRQTPEPESTRKTKRRRKLSPMDDVSQSGSDQSMAEKEPIPSSNSLAVDQVSISSVLTQASSLPEEYDPKSLGATTSDGNLRLPHVIISIALDEDQVLNIGACSEWFASFPALAQYAKVQSVYRSYSTLLIISLPVVLWDLLPEDPACNFIGYVKSEGIFSTGARTQGKHLLDTEGDVSMSLIQHSYDFPVWQSQSSNTGTHRAPTPGPFSRPPSAPGSISARSMSPTSGNPMRFPGDPLSFFKPTTGGDQGRVRFNKRMAPGASVTRSKIETASQDELSISGLPKENPKAKPMRTAQQQIESSSSQQEPNSSELQRDNYPTGPPEKKSRTNTPWTPADEKRLKAMRDAGNNWAEIAKTFPSRTEGSVKKHWYKDMQYAEFAEDESQALLNAIKEYEKNKWKVIGAKVGKPAKVCEQYAKEHFSGRV